MNHEVRDERKWFVSYTHPNKEAFAAVNLERQGFPAYMPLVERMVRHARRARCTLRPLFPRYVFVSLDLDVDRWRAVQGTFGVLGLLMDGNRPRATPQGLVERMMAFSDPENGLLPGPNLDPGGPVRFLFGPFQDKLGTITQLSDSGRVQVLLEILGSPREVTVPASQLLSVGR